MRKILAGAALTAGLALAPAIDAVHAQDESTSEEDDGNGEIGLLGLAGLIGLAGLAGLKRRDRHDDRRTTTSADRSYSAPR